ncbi:MAG: sigma-70 family RNA polymerase sigma factor [Saprospiraceae bacterium]
MIKATQNEDLYLLEGMQRGDESAIKKIYDLALLSVITWVEENSGTEADARDVFQDALLALYRRLNGGDFELSCTLKSYLRIVCKNLWLAKIRKSGKVSHLDKEKEENQVMDQEIIEQIETNERRKFFYRHFEKLAESCQKIMAMFFDKIPLAEIAQKMDTTEAYIKMRKFQCKEQLVKSIQADKEFLAHKL